MTSENRPSIRLKLTTLVAACVVPVWLIAGFLVLHTYTSKWEQVQSNMRERAQALTRGVDRELTAVQAALTAFSTSPGFRSGDLQGLHRQARELLGWYQGADIIIADATGQQVVNSYRPFGTQLPKRNNLSTVERIFRTGKPIVSDLFFGAVTKRPLIGIDVPVFIDGAVAYDLAMTFPSDRVASVLSRDILPAEWCGTILDSKGVVAASTRHGDPAVGHQAVREILGAVGKGAHGSAVVTTAAGRRHFVVFSRSSVSSWAVAIMVPEEVVMAETYRWLFAAIAVAGAISLVGICLALWIGRKIACDTRALVAPALAIGRGEPVLDSGHHTVKETAEVAAALVQASTLLQEHARERDRAERQLSLAIEDLKKETEQRLGAMEELRQKDRLLIQQSRQAAMGEMIGNIAHQWRQPLNALALSVQQVSLYHELGLLDKAFLAENYATSMSLIEHMSSTIDDFRNYFKPDREMENFDIREAVQKSMSLLEGTFRSHGIETAVTSEGITTASGYPNEFAQALLNLLTNAKDVLVERKVSDPRIEVTIRRKGERTVVTVTDNAGGISHEILEKIFDPYFTTKGPQSGTGLGLFMTRTIIEKMAGRLQVRNVEQGAEFTIEV